jgi:hypothetical protein
MPKYYPGQTWVIFWHITWTRPHYYINMTAAAAFFYCILSENANHIKSDVTFLFLKIQKNFLYEN